MTVDMSKMRQSYEDQQKGGDILNFDQGETLLYIHPPCRGADDKWEPTTGLPYVPVTVHYKVGKDGAMVVSLDPDRNSIIEHPFVKRFLKKRKMKLTGSCPVAAELESGSMSDDEADESRAQTKYLWGMTPLKFRASSREEWHKITPKPSVAMVGKQIYDGIMEAFFDNGDITDMDGAILVRVIRKGKDRTTKYEVKVDPSSLKKPFKLPAKLRAAIVKAIEEEGDCDLFQLTSNLMKSPADVEALLSGVKSSSDPDDDDDEADDDEPEPRRKASKKRKPEPKPEDDEGDDALDDEDDEPPPKKAAKKPEPEEEDDDDLDDLDDDDEDDEPPPKKSSKKTSKKAAKKVEPEPEDDDEDDEEDEPPPPKKSSKKAEPEEDDEDDLGLDDLEAALDELDEEEQKAPPKKKASKKAGKKRAT